MSYTLAVVPAWSRTGTPKHLEAEIGNWTFEGPGWYLYHNHCALVIRHDVAQGVSPWVKKFTPDEQFTFHHYDCDVGYTAFGVVTPPTRIDLRDDESSASISSARRQRDEDEALQTISMTKEEAKIELIRLGYVTVSKWTGKMMEKKLNQHAKSVGQVKQYEVK